MKKVYYIEARFQSEGEPGWLHDWDDHSADLAEVHATLKAYEARAIECGRSPWWQGEVLWTSEFSNYRIDSTVEMDEEELG